MHAFIFYIAIPLSSVASKQDKIVDRLACIAYFNVKARGTACSGLPHNALHWLLHTQAGKIRVYM